VYLACPQESGPQKENLAPRPLYAIAHMTRCLMQWEPPALQSCGGSEQAAGKERQECGFCRCVEVLCTETAKSCHAFGQLT